MGSFRVADAINESSCLLVAFFKHTSGIPSVYIRNCGEQHSRTTWVS